MSQIIALVDPLPAPVQEPVPENFIDALKFDVAMRDWVAAQSAGQRQWVGLTDEEKRQIFEREDYQGWLDYINAIEAKLKEKNGGSRTYD
jgi:hypothetical protein